VLESNVNNVPAGSMWLVLQFVSPSVRHSYRTIPEHCIRAVSMCDRPRGWGTGYRRGGALEPGETISRLLPNAWDNNPNTVSLEVHTRILVSRTVPGSLLYDEWVEVLLPNHGWINRCHFNSDSEYLRRLC